MKYRRRIYYSASQRAEIWDRWQRGESMSSIGRLVLDYRVRQYGGNWESITQQVALTYTNCNYGNQRPYFVCPGIVDGRYCGRRVGKLFSGGRYFLCRHCYNIGYSSQSEARYDRMLRRANKLRMALGGEPGTAHWIADKPKGMWQRTYQRKRFEIEWCENKANHLLIAKYSQFLNQDDLDMYFEN